MIKRAVARAEAWAGVRDSLTTVVPSIVAYGIVWGGLARQAGLSLGELVVMCLLVSAGTAQFVALPMLQAGAPAWLLIVTTYIVNLRHYLMAASLAPYFAHLSRGRLALLAHGISDESYALTMARFARQPAHPAYFAGTAAATFAAWYTGDHPRGGARRPHPRSPPVRARLRVPRRVHRDPRADDPGALAMGGRGRRRGGGARGEGNDRRHLAHRRGRARRLPRRCLAGAARQRGGARGRTGGGDPGSATEPIRVRLGLLLTFAGMGVATYLTRAPLLLALARRRLPGWLERYFAALPIALLTALALPLVLLAPGDAPPGPPPWLTDLPAAVAVAVAGPPHGASPGGRRRRRPASPPRCAPC